MTIAFEKLADDFNVCAFGERILKFVGVVWDGAAVEPALGGRGARVGA